MRVGRTLVAGASGILGDALLRSPRLEDGLGVVFTHDSPHPAVRVDLRDLSAVRELVREVRPDVVVDTVGLTDVDRCENDPAEAFAVNVLTSSNLALSLSEAAPHALLVYISSDQVYSGDGPHVESRPAPINVYGATKHCGELAARQAPRALCLRTNFFGPSDVRPSFTDWIAGAVRENRRVVLDDRAIFSPLHLADVVELVADCVERGLTGTYNLGARTAMRKVEFAETVAALVRPGAEQLVERRRAAVSGRAPRPQDLALDVSSLEDALGRRLPTVEDGLDRLSAMVHTASDGA